jgi:hypothetical protein
LAADRRPGPYARAGGDHDLVLALGVDGDQRGAGRGRRLHGDAGEVDAVGPQQRQRLVGHGVGADPADQANLRPQPPGGQRLVGALATRIAGQGRAGHRFARGR